MVRGALVNFDDDAPKGRRPGIDLGPGILVKAACCQRDPDDIAPSPSLRTKVSSETHPSKTP